MGTGDDGCMVCMCVGRRGVLRLGLWLSEGFFFFLSFIQAVFFFPSMENLKRKV